MKKPISLALIMLLGLAGCEQQADESQPAEQAAQPAEQQVPGQEVVLRVDGTPITEEMVQFHLLRRTGGQAQNLSEEQRDALIRELVDMVLLSQEAQKQGLADKPEIQARLASVRHALLAQAAVEGLRETQPVGEKEVQAEYDKTYGGEQGQEYHARHILLENQEAAQQVIQQLNEGADFAELAKEKSTGPSGPMGGDLGWFQPDQMVEPFSEAVQQLEPGQYTKEPVETRFGWHVIKLEEARAQPAPALEEVAPQIENQLAQQQIEGYLDELRQQANIQYEQPELKPEQGQSEGGQQDEQQTEEQQGQ